MFKLSCFKCIKTEIFQRDTEQYTQMSTNADQSNIFRLNNSLNVSTILIICLMAYCNSLLGGGLAQLVATLVGLTKLLYAGPG